MPPPPPHSLCPFMHMHTWGGGGGGGGGGEEWLGTTNATAVGYLLAFMWPCGLRFADMYGKVSVKLNDTVRYAIAL